MCSFVNYLAPLFITMLPADWALQCTLVKLNVKQVTC